MRNASPLPPDAAEELLRLFWQRLGGTSASGEEASNQERDAAQHIVAAVGPAADVVTLAAARQRLAHAREVIPLLRS